MKDKKWNRKRILKTIGKCFLVLLVLFFILVLIIRTPWAQSLIVTRITEYVSNKTQTKVEVSKVFITFSGDVQVEGIYLEDKQGDTLLYAKELQMDLPIYPLIAKNELSIDDVEATGLVANISRNNEQKDFNFSFLLDAFASSEENTSTAEPMSISLGDFQLTNWKLRYNDAYLGTQINVKLGELEIEVTEFDLEEMHFGVDDFVLKNSQLSYEQTRPFPISNDTTASTPPKIQIDNFEIAEVAIEYNSKPDGIRTKMQLSDMGLEETAIDLSKNSYKTGGIRLKNSSLQLTLNQPKDSTKSSEPSAPFAWPDMELVAEELNLESNSLDFSKNGNVPNDSIFNPDAFLIDHIALKANDFRYIPKDFHVGITNFSFKEGSGIALKQLGFEAGISDTKAVISNLKVQLNNSVANANIDLQYKSIDNAFDNPQNSTLQISLNQLHVQPSDIQSFLPELQKNDYINALAQHAITGSVKANGSLKMVDEFDTQLEWGSSSILMQGSLSNIMEMDSLAYNLKNIDIKSTEKDIRPFISKDSISFKIPENITLTGTLKGDLESIKTKSIVKIPEGRIILNAFANFGNQKRFDGTISTDSLQLGALLQNKNIGAISLELKGSGSGTELADMDAQVEGTISQLQLNQYEYKDIQLEGELNNGTGQVALAIADENLDLTADTSIDLTSENNAITFTLNIEGADLRKLGFTRDDIKIAGNIEGSYNGSSNNYTVNTSIKNGIAVSDNKQFQIAPILLNAHVQDSITDATVESGFINGGLYSNASPDRIRTALKKQLENYFSTDSTLSADLVDVEARLDLALKPTPIISKVFFNGVEDLDSLNIDADFNSKTKKLGGKISVPKFTYAGSTVDSLEVNLKGDSTNLNFYAGLKNFEYDPILLKRTHIEGNLKNKELVLDFSSVNDTTQIMHISSELVFKKDTLSLHISPKNLLLNTKSWEIPDDNKIVMAESFTEFQNLVLSRNGQKLEVSTTVPQMENEHIGIIFENFQLQTFLSLLNPDEALAKGTVQGNFVILNPYEATGLVSKLDISDFRLMQNPLGSLSLNASSKSLSDYDFDLKLSGGGADLTLTGGYVAHQNGSDLNMDLDIQKFETSIVQGFLKDEISDPSGYFSGHMKVGGTLNDPMYSGTLNFNDVGLTLSAFKTNLSVKEQTLDLNEEEIIFDDFRINDTNKGTLVLDGTVFTEELLNPRFDLSVQADKFTMLDSKKGDNELVYGKAIVDTELEVTGDLELPIINGKLTIGDATDLTYLVPKTQYEIQEREGVVIFVNRENPDAILTRNTGETTNSIFEGMDISTTLQISDESVFTIVLDERTGDMLQASGNATLNLNIDPNQSIRLSGRLDLNSGFYKTSLYNLVNREFTINDGSNVVWSGDPYNATLDVTATYEVETSAAPLMSSISYGQDTGISGQYQRPAKFLVYLMVDGEITAPEISFALDMPENVQGSYGGGVYGRIQQLNEQESELNKQVFSLLALNRFYPTSGSDGSNGGAVAIARDNVNKVLSSELNSISNKIMGNTGLELDFDLDSFQENQGDGYQNRTQLNINASKKLFDDRFIVTAGSAVDVEGKSSSSDTATPVIGNVTLEYLLNEEGTYRLKGFRRQEYQNVIDGQLIVTGLAFIFNREFNKFSQLFNPIKPKSKEEEITETDNDKKKP